MSQPEPTLEARIGRMEKVLFAGKEDHFLLAWGRLMTHAAQSRWSVVFLGSALIASVAGNVAFALRWSKRDTLIFLKDERTGNLVPLATAAGMTAASDERDEAEITGFARRWVTDAFAYNPLNVKDNVLLALRTVDTSAQAIVKAQLRLDERVANRDAGISVMLLDDPERGKAPAVSIVRRDPLEVSVIFQRMAVASATGETKELAPIVCNIQFRLIPRSTINPSGLVISDLTVAKS